MIHPGVSQDEKAIPVVSIWSLQDDFLHFIIFWNQRNRIFFPLGGGVLRWTGKIP